MWVFCVAQTRTDMVAPGPMPVAPPKELHRLGSYLATLETDPDDPEALAGIKRLAQERDVERLGADPTRQLETARQVHELRSEFSTVARLIEVELDLIENGDALAASLWKELGRLRAEYLLDGAGARAAYTRALELLPADSEITEALKRLDQADTSWKKFAKRFVEEAESAADLSLKTSLLLRAASLAWENRRKAKAKEADRLFAEVLEIDKGNLRAILLYEHTLREREEWKDLGQHLLDSAEAVHDKQASHNLYVRAARVFARKLHDKSRAAACYERVLSNDPGNGEAMSFLTDRFTETERWDDLVLLYESALRVPHKLDVEQGILVQLGMVHYRMRNKPEDADPYFGRLRKLDPTHPAMLDFYRQHLQQSGELERLLRILSDAQRIVSDPARRLALAVETAQLAQKTQGMGERAIEAWKNVQRLDPQHAEAARVLKELYARSEKWNALCEVLKAQIDATPDASASEKIELLRELAIVYRDKLRLDGMLINVYNTILRLLPHDRATLESLAEKYRELGRWNDLINVLIADADANADRAHRIETYLKVAGLWLEHFSNYNQASGPLEKVLELDPGNRSALSMLREIYEKKRAWKQLFEVLKKERDVATDPEQRAGLTMQLASLAAERLHRYDDAVALWREVAEQTSAGSFPAPASSSDEPGTTRSSSAGFAALEAIEKLAEREKDWKTLSGVLDQQVARQKDPEDKIRILLKLGSVYADRLNDPSAAVSVFRRVLEIDPKQGRALRSLRDSLVAAGDWDAVEALYDRAGDLDGLVDVLSGEADRVTARDAKIALSLRVARLLEQRIAEPMRAQRSYERVLSVDPEHVQAARALAPIYEHDEKWSRLYAMHEIVLRSLPSGETTERLDILRRLRLLAQDKLRDAGFAFSHALAAYQLAPTDDSVRESLERSAELAQSFDKVVDAYTARAESKAAAPSEALDLRRRIALIATVRLGKPELAAAQWEIVLAAVPTDAGALTALDRIYRAANRTADVRKLLLHKLTVAEDAEARWPLLEELAKLEEEELKDYESAAEHYRALADLQSDNTEVWAALDRLALAAGRFDELASALEWRVQLAQDKTAKVELGARLGSVFLEKLSEPERAQAVFAEVVELDPAHGASIAALEQLAQAQPKLAEQIYPILERAYERAGRYDKLAKYLQERVASTRDEPELRRLRLRLAEISSGQLGDALGAYASLEAAFLQEPEDTSLWDRLAEAAETASQQRALASAYARAVDRESLEPADRIELATRVARLYDEVLGEPLEAEPFHRRVLAHDPLSERAFIALKDLYTNEERWEDLQGLYRRRFEETTDAEVKLELLLQVCFLFEEILEQPDKAVEAYRSVLELIPDHGPSRRTLERLYEQLDRYRDLANLLRSNLDHAEGYDQVDTLYRLAELHDTKLAEPSQAVEYYEQVLHVQPHHLRTQAALSRLLAVESLRQRIAAILEPTYESQGAYADLVRVLEIQLADIAEATDKAELLFRIGGLYESRLRDTDGAFSAYARAVEAAPGLVAAREALARVAAGREVHRRKRGQVLEHASANISDPDVLIDVLQELGQLSIDELDDKAAAERCYTRLLELATGRDDVVLEAARCLERIHLQTGDYAGLARDLSKQVELEFDPRLREQLLVRLAELYGQRLDNPALAIEAQRRRLETDADNADALRALERLYAATGGWEELVEVLGRRMPLARDPAEQRAIARRGALVLEEKVGDVARAIEAHREVAASFGPDRDTLHSLARLYETAGQNNELLEVLESDVEFCATPAERAALRFRIAELLKDKLAEPERAIAAYESALDDDPEHAGSLAALDAIMADESSQFQRDAARAAAPRYERLARFDKLLAVLELLAKTDDEHDKLEALHKAAGVAEHGLHDPLLAMSYVGKALQAAGSQSNLPELLAEYGRLAEVTGRYAEYVAGLRGIVTELGDPEQRSFVYRSIATAAQEKLQDATLARASYRKVLEEDAEDVPALDALLRLDEEAQDYPALIDVLGKKIGLSLEPRVRLDLLERRADVYERGLDDAEKAIGALEEVVSEEPRATAFASLERLYLRTHRFTDLAALYEQQLDRGVGAAVDLRYKLANTHRQYLGDTGTALGHLRDALTDDPDHPDSVGLAEAIMSEQGEHRTLAAEILEPGYLARMDWEKLTGALRVRVDAESNSDERVRLLVRLARIYEEQLEDFDETLEIYSRLYREDFRDEEVWETLTRLAKVGGHWNRLAKILSEPLADNPVDDELMAKLARYVGSLYDEKTGNLVKAAEFYAKALAFDPSDAFAFRMLESAYLRGGNHAALLALYSQQAEQAVDDSERVALLHKRARLQRGELRELTNAIATFREILDIAPTDHVAVASLEALLAEAKDFTGLSEHLRWRIEHAASPKEELELKYRLGELLLSAQEDEEGALDLFDQIIHVEPRHGATLAALERIVQGEKHRLRVTEILEPVYRQLDQWKKLVAIHEARLLLLTDRAEIARLLSEVGELHEKRGNDLGRAFNAYARAFTADPADETVRGHIDRLATATGAWADHVGAYEAALAETAEASAQLPLLQMIARVHDEKRGDPRAAILAYERMLKIEPTDAATLDALEQLHTMVGDWRGLVSVLERKAVLAYGSDRADLLRRIGSVFEEFVVDREAAIDAYKRAAAELDTDELALEALDRLYAMTGQALPLFETLKRRVELASDPALRVELGLRLGFLADTRLHYSEEAITAYRRVLDDDDANATAISHLSALYQRLGMWNELLENLRLQVALASAPATRVALHCRAGEILLDKLLDPGEAIESFRRALDEDPQCVAAIDALLSLTVREEHRAQAAAVVEPLLREQGRYDDLVRLINRKIDSLIDPAERRAELVRLAEVEEHGRRDKFAAFEALSKALAGDTPDEFVQEELERLARELASWSKYFSVLMDRAARLPDPRDAALLFRRAGRVAEEELGDDARAIEAFRSASVHDDDADESLIALDRLYEKTQQWELLVDVLERRVSADISGADRAELLVRLGFLRGQRCGDPRGAFAAYKEVLDNDPGDASALAGMQLLGERDELVSDVLEVLERCYRETNAVEKVVELFELRSRLAATDAEKARLLREAAGLWERDLNEPGRAFLRLRQAFELDCQDLSQLDELERMAGVCGAFSELSALAERVLSGSLLEPSARRELALRAAAWYRDFIGDTAGELRCLRIALALDAEDQDIHARLTEVLREEGDRRALLTALRAFAEIDDDEPRALASLHEAGALALELSDQEAAAACFGRVLELEPEDAAALSALAELRTNQGRYAEATQLLSRWLAVETDPERRIVLHHGIAEAHAGLLNDAEQAATSYRALLEEFPDDERAVTSLEDLFERLGRWRELEQSLRERLERAERPEQRVDVRLRLARLSEVQLGRPELALEQLREVLADAPDHDAAAAEFERLLRAAGSHEELASWLEQRAADARAAGDPQRAEHVLRALAEHYEEQLGDPQRAIEALLQRYEISPDLPVVQELVRLYEVTGQLARVAEFMEFQISLETPHAGLATAHKLADLAATRLRDQELVQRALLTARRLAPRDAQTIAKLRQHYESRGACEDLAQLLQEEAAMREKPAEQAAMLREIAVLYATRIGDASRGITYLERAMSLMPGERETLVALCDLYISSGRENSAIPLLDQIIASYGGRRAKEVASYEHRLGRAYEGSGKVEEAYKHYDAAFRIDLTSVPVLRDLGRLCLVRGDLDRAQKTYRALLLQKLGEDAGIHKADVYYYLGEISAKQGDKAKAKAMLERAISEGGQHERARALLAQL
jgi:tetratricopeptide (TPR) repeat protein